jgi:hypothetical protein
VPNQLRAGLVHHNAYSRLMVRLGLKPANDHRKKQGPTLEEILASGGRRYPRKVPG